MKNALGHPARLVPLAFLVAILLGTLLLMLPASRAGEGSAPFLTALFTATSAVSVTGLVVVDTASYWSGFGRAVILLLFQIGGFGIMSGATLLGLLVARRLSLTTRLITQAETRGLELGDVVLVLRLVLMVTLLAEALIALVLAARFHWGHGMALRDAAWHGLFQAVSAFNNAGFASFSDGMARFAGDPLVLLPVMAGVVLGGLGIPVLHDLRRHPRSPTRWSLHTKLTLSGTGILFLAGFGASLAYEWANPATLGALPPAERVLNAAFHSVMTRSGGFNTMDIGAMQDTTLAASWGLMLVGGGSASTAGGFKVSTFVILGLVVLAVARGEPDATAFRRRIPPEVQRQALAVVLLGIGLAGFGTLALLSLTELPLRDVIFEVVSATATVGLSTGITAELPPAAQAVLIILMYVGRIGSVTAATALALRRRKNPFRYPEERPIVG